MPLIQEGGAGAIDVGPFVEDYFATSTWVASGTGETIVNNLNMSAGSLILTKDVGSIDSWRLGHSSSTGIFLATDSKAPASSGNFLTSFNNNGFTTSIAYSTNGNYAAFAFLEAEGFMKRITWSGTNAARTISHSLGVAPTFMIVKCTSGLYPWAIWEAGFQYPGIGWFGFDAYGNKNSGNLWGTANINTSPANASYINIGTADETNLSGGSFVGYLFADQGPTGLLRTGTAMTDSSGNVTVSLGWEPQFVMYKLDNTTNWRIWDLSQTYRLTNDFGLYPSSSAARATGITTILVPTADGFRLQGFGANTRATYIAVRAGLMRKPTSGSSVLGINNRTGNGANTTVAGWAPNNSDIYIIRPRQSASTTIITRERGLQSMLTTNNGNADFNNADYIRHFLSTGFALGTNADVNPVGIAVISYAIKRARGFCDLVRYKGTGSAHTEKHNLNAIPRLIITKCVDAASRSWAVQLVGYHGGYLWLNAVDAYAADSTAWNNTAATATNFTVGTKVETNQSTLEFETLLFANRTGVCKIDTYTGNGSSQNIDCGFVSGARFVLIKAVSVTGNWLFFDTTRGIISGNDPSMHLNAAAAEVTGTDYLAPYSPGFGVNNSSFTNANGVVYMYMAIA